MVAPTLWPFAPNWRQPYAVSYAFVTDIFTSRSGREQRRAQRSTPRRAFKFTITHTGQDFRTLNRVLKTAQGYAMTLPDLSRQRRVTATQLNSGAVTIPLDTAAADWLAPGKIIILADRSGYQSATVSSVNLTAATVTVAAPLARNWLGAKIHPAVTGWLDQSLDAQKFGNRTREMGIVFAAQPGETTTPLPADPQEIFNRREVLFFNHNFATSVSENFRRTRDPIDFGRGVTVTVVPVAFTSRTRQFQLLARSPAELTPVRDAFLRMKGQRGEFYLPSMDDDFTLISATSTTATFAGTDIDASFHGDGLNRAVMIERLGYRYFRRISAAAVSGGNSVITTDSAWPCPMDASAIVTWLVVHRFAVDQLDIEHLTDTAAKTQVSVVSLEDYAVSDTDSALGALDATAQYVLDSWGYSTSLHIFDGLAGLISKYKDITT